MMISFQAQSQNMVLSDITCREIYKQTNLSKYVGGKAIGLCTTFSHLVPTFFVITPQLTSPEKLQKNIHYNDALSFIKFIELIRKRKGKIYIRSSAKDELITERGKFRSEVCEPTVKNIFSTLESLRSNPIEFHSEQKETDACQLAYVVQYYIDWRAKGHLSNERRISENPEQWRCEYYFENQSFAKAEWLTIKKNRARHIDPFCSTQEQLIAVLESIAAFHIGETGKRFHFEWIWDSKRVWIVQKDIENFTEEGNKPSLIYEDFLVSAPPPSKKLNAFSLFQFDNKKWPKLNALSTFQECNLPVVDFFLLSDNACLRELCSGRFPLKLYDDLTILLEQPLVIRTDIKLEGSANPLFLLPRSNLLKSTEEVKAFLIDAAFQLSSIGNTPENICFIAHHYIPATSSALAYASPNATNVLIHSSWGMPDGLLYHGYDTHLVCTTDLGTDILEQEIKHKGEYINIGECGEWTQCKVEAPWDWQASILDSDTLVIAGYASKIASFLKKPIIAMFLVGIPGSAGYGNVLPWFYSVCSYDTNFPSTSGHVSYNKKCQSAWKIDPPSASKIDPP